MATVPSSLTNRKVKGVVRYASYMVNGEEVYGTAQLLIGSGYLFRKDGERQARLISKGDPDLLLYGLVEMADAQYAADLKARAWRS